MPPKRQGLGAGTASKRPPEAAKLADPKLIRALYTKFHQGKQRQALEALEEHNRAHPSGLGYLALSRMHALLGMREALQVGLQLLGTCQGCWLQALPELSSLARQSCHSAWVRKLLGQALHKGHPHQV